MPGRPRPPRPGRSAGCGPRHLDNGAVRAARRQPERVARALHDERRDEHAVQLRQAALRRGCIGAARGVELARGSGRPPDGNAVRLLDEPDAEPRGKGLVGGGDEIRCRHVAARAVTEDECGAGPLHQVQVRPRLAVRSVDLDGGRPCHAVTAAPAA
jgi:hypothetical protein